MPIPVNKLGAGFFGAGSADEDPQGIKNYARKGSDPFSGNVDWEAYQTPPPDTTPITPDGGLNPFLIPDAFSYLSHLKYLPFRSFPMSLRLLDNYRRDSVTSPIAWQPRYYQVPTDSSILVPAGDQFYYEQRVARGAVIWGYSFNLVTTDGVHIDDLRVSLMDVRNQYEITYGAANNNFVKANAFRANLSGGGAQNGWPCVLASEPYEVSGDGLVAITLVNTSDTDAPATLVIMTLEPGGSPQ